MHILLLLVHLLAPSTTPVLLESPAVFDTAGPAHPAKGTRAGRFVTRDVPVAGTRHRIAIWLPPGYDRARNWPAMVFLHGSGECGTDGLRSTQVGLGPALIAHPDRWPMVVVFPQKPRDDEEWEERETLVLAALDDALKEFRVDPRRVALAGMSQGGHGAWMIAARHPERWSCVVPICGYGRVRTIATRIAHLPVWAFHGLKDDVVDPGDTRLIIQAIRSERTRLGLDPGEARMTLYTDANHNSWDPALAERALPGWVLSAR